MESLTSYMRMAYTLAARDMFSQKLSQIEVFMPERWGLLLTAYLTSMRLLASLN
jgi:hypothetical protein